MAALLSLGLGWRFLPGALVASDEELKAFASVFLTLGGALLGASAIVFSLVMFAVQINVERLPHSLFHRISTDRSLFSVFLATLALSGVVTACALIPTTHWLAPALAIVFTSTGAIATLFAYAYRRALSLVSPVRQIETIASVARRSLAKRTVQATRLAPLLRASQEVSQSLSPHDVPRLVFFQLNPGWQSDAQQGVAHLISFARRYGRDGDYEVSAAAHRAIVLVARSYVVAKGKTFFAHSLLLENPYATDGFINEILELLRQNAELALSDRNERMAEQAFHTFAALCEEFSRIDYGDEHAPKSHANIAAGYLTSSVKAALPHGVPDVLMEGVQTIGVAARSLLTHGDHIDAAALTTDLTLIAMSGVAAPSYRPVTTFAVEEQARLLFDLIRSSAPDARYSARSVRRNIEGVARAFLNVPDTMLAGVQSSCLAGYFSGTSQNAFLAWLTKLCNAVSEAGSDDKNAQRLLANVEHWADDLFSPFKELFVNAVEREAPLLHDLVHWITHVTQALLAMSNAPACQPHVLEKLRKNATWLIAVLGWVPDNKAAIAFVENSQITEKLFSAALDAHDRKCTEVAQSIRDLLIRWTLRGGKYETGWGILERGCEALAVLELCLGSDGSQLFADISERLSEPSAPAAEIRRHTARGLRRRLRESLYRGPLSPVDRAIARVDHSHLRSVLGLIASALSPID